MIVNVVGNNIFDILFILGLVALLRLLIFALKMIPPDVAHMIGICLLALLRSQDGVIDHSLLDFNQAEMSSHVTATILSYLLIHLETATNDATKYDESRRQI